MIVMIAAQLISAGSANGRPISPAGRGPGRRRAQGKVEVVRQECLRLKGLLDDFLRFTRVHHPRLQATDLNRLVHRVLEFFRPQAEEAGVEIVEYLDPDLPRVTLDADAFYGAILNLVLNAQQSMPGGGQLMVRTGPCRRGVGSSCSPVLRFQSLGQTPVASTLTRTSPSFGSPRSIS